MGNQTQELDNLLSTANYPNLKQSHTVTIDKILEILNFQYGTPESSGAWNDDLIRQAVAALRDQTRYQNTGSIVIVNLNSDLKKSASRNYTQLGSVLPGDAGKIPYAVDRNYPALLMTRLRGEVNSQGGWHGVPFWVPVIRFPDGNYAFSVNES